MFKLCRFNKNYLEEVFVFLQECLPQSGRKLELNGRHKMLYNIEDTFDDFWCLFHDTRIIGTVAVKKLDSKKCELKLLYLLETYHGKGLGRRLENK